jgi:Taurine catabolism dioxygenase TauD, TfdA family
MSVYMFTESELPPPRLDSPAAWYGPTISEERESWFQTLPVAEVEEISAAADYFIEQNDAIADTIHTSSRSSSSSSSSSSDTLSINILTECDEALRRLLPQTTRRFEDLTQRQLLTGIGFAVVRGIPTQSWPHEKCAAAFLIIGHLMGGLRQQNKQGHVLGHVTDLGLSSADPSVRVYQTSERQTFHTDSCDVVGLLCLHKAKEGGLSSVVSSETIYNEIYRTRPDLLKLLLDPVPTDRRGEVPEGCLPYYNIPVFSYYHGQVTAIYQRQYIDSSQRFEDAPRLTSAMVEALNLFDAMADDPRLHLEMQLEPGDMQFVHNHNLLHDRTAFLDYPENERKRYLLRIWIAPENARPLPPIFTERFGSVEVGNRGGVALQGVEPVINLHPPKVGNRI